MNESFDRDDARATVWRMSMLNFAGRSLVVALLLAVPWASAVRAATVSQDLIDRAKAEGSLTFYTVDLATKPVTDAFEKKYGIRVTTQRLDNPSLALRLSNETRANRPIADVICMATGITDVVNAQLLRPFKAVNAEDLNPRFRDPNGYWVTVMQYLHTAIINTDLLAQNAPKNYENLLSPGLNGKIAWKPYDMTGGIGFVGHILTLRGETAGMDYLSKLRAQNVQSVEMSSTALTDQVAAGQYAIALQTLSKDAERLKSNGAPVQYLNLSPIAVSLDTIALPIKSAHPNAGLLFVEFSLSPEGQTAYGLNYIPVRTDVPRKSPLKLDDPKEFNILDPNIIATGYRHWTDVFNRLFR